MLLNLSDDAFDQPAKGWLATLVNDWPELTQAQIRDELKRILDVCVNGSLCTGTVIYALDVAWRDAGGGQPEPDTRGAG